MAEPRRATGAVSQRSGQRPVSTPQQDDVVITRERSHPVHVTVRLLASPVQLNASSREDAISLVRSYAQEHRVDVWYRDGGDYHLLEQHRGEEHEAATNVTSSRKEKS